MAELDDVQTIARRVYRYVAENAHGNDAAAAWAGAMAREIVRMRTQILQQASENARVIASNTSRHEWKA